ncbi:hypothetical protein ACIGW5_25980 [Streptomyces prasinus]|uniref:hypothetical protein n=1 Tax=Streptomyces TaxID=1883 RepID=UPI0035F4F809
MTALAARARAEGVPLWIARRFAQGPAGPVTVTVDRRLVRVDVWGPGAPAVRIRAPRGFHPDSPEPGKGLRLTVGEVAAELVLRKRLRKSKSSVEVRLPDRSWVLSRKDAESSWLLRDERRVALLARPSRRPEQATVLLPLAPVRYESPDPLDAVMAQVFAVAFGLGDTTGSARFRSKYRPGDGHEPAGDASWDRPWFSNLGRGRDDNEPGGGDGWGSDGGDGGSGDGGGGDSGGGGDGGGGGGD